MLGSLERISEFTLEGWVEPERDESVSLALEVDARPAGVVELPTVQAQGRTLFRVPLPAWVFDGQRHLIEVRSRGLPIGSPLSFQSHYSGKLDGVDGNYIYGWVVDLSRPGSAIAVELIVNGRARALTNASTFRSDLRGAGYGSGHNGFSFHLPELSSGERSLSLQIRIAGTDLLLGDDPILAISSARYLTFLDSFQTGIRHFVNLAGRDCESGLSKVIDTLDPVQLRELLKKSFGGGSLADLLYFERRVGSSETRLEISTTYSFPDFSTDIGVRWPSYRHASQPIDIVVPIYGGLEETLQCLRSVIGSGPLSRYEVVCVLDNPGNDELTEAVTGLAESAHLTVVQNKSNLGFVKSVNLGMRLHPDRDVVLLNSDTVVHADWLDRLRRAAYSSPEIGTVTPFSNSATICSYPRFNQDNDLPEDCDDKNLDSLCESENDTAVVDIPTAIGFCMYIRRDCLSNVGLFDEESFGKGYGEENDFCRRAARRGWRNVLATDIFVRHLGSVSFGPEKTDLIARNLKRLGDLHPRYHDQISAFIKDDPIHPYRRRLDAARLRRAAGSILCLITHEFGGGTNAYVDRIAQEVSESGLMPLIVRCTRDGTVSLAVPAGSASAQKHPLVLPNLVYQVQRDIAALQSDLSRLPIVHFHIQTNINIPQAILDLPDRLGTSYDCTVHDYSWICPKVNLVDDSRKYCGEPPVGVCERCVKLSQAHAEWNVDLSEGDPVGRLRLQSEKILIGARRVFCPSVDAKNRMSRYFPAANLSLSPHEDRLLPADPVAVPHQSGHQINVAVIGAISVEKGSEVLRRCAIDAWKRQLPLRFVVIGYTNDDGSFHNLPNVRILGRYEDAGIDKILRAESLTLSFFPAVWPETFSYTLSIAFRHRLFPVAFDLGAISERIRTTGFGSLLPLAAADSPETINNALITNASWMKTAEPLSFSDTTYRDIIQEYYGLPDALPPPLSSILELNPSK
jgi:GT2 family glycosyltransferase